MRFMFLKPSESTISSELDTQDAEKVRTVSLYLSFVVNVAPIESLHILFFCFTSFLLFGHVKQV